MRGYIGKVTARLRSGQSGFTLIEVLVSAVLFSTGIVATIGILDTANHATNVAQRHQTAIEIAERELEQIADLNYSQISLTVTPQSSADPNSPLNRVSGPLFEAETGQDETMVVGGDSAAVNPGPETVSEGDVSAQVYRFITWVDAPSFQGCTQNCDSTQDYKRVTVAIQATNGTFKGFDKYVIASTLRIDPFLGPEGQVSQPPDPNPTQAHDNFYLYDTPAANCTSNSYQQPSGDHATHDSLGWCDSQAADYPDLMGIDAPPNPYEPSLPQLYIYSSDLSGEYTGGLAIQRSTDCSPSGLSKYQVHNWVSDPVSASSYELTGKISFDFWSAAVGGQSGMGKACVWLYDRNMVGGQPQDTQIASSSYTLTNWPGEPANLSFTFSHSAYTLLPGHMLRFALATSSVSDTDLQFIYDHPSYPTFVQVRTTTPISQ